MEYQTLTRRQAILLDLFPKKPTRFLNKLDDYFCDPAHKKAKEIFDYTDFLLSRWDTWYDPSYDFVYEVIKRLLERYYLFDEADMSPIGGYKCLRHAIQLDTFKNGDPYAVVQFNSSDYERMYMDSRHLGQYNQTYLKRISNWMTRMGNSRYGYVITIGYGNAESISEDVSKYCKLWQR